MIINYLTASSKSYFNVVVYTLLWFITEPSCVCVFTMANQLFPRTTPQWPLISIPVVWPHYGPVDTG